MTYIAALEWTFGAYGLLMLLALWFRGVYCFVSLSVKKLGVPTTVTLGICLGLVIISQTVYFCANVHASDSSLLLAMLSVCFTAVTLATAGGALEDSKK